MKVSNSVLFGWLVHTPSHCININGLAVTPTKMAMPWPFKLCPRFCSCIYGARLLNKRSV